ncbi:MAG: hypothetical protein ACI4QV_02590 [Acutalibacteraceae bacterium]
MPEQFKDAVCIDSGRVYDSCCDRDCLEDLRVFFSNCDQTLVDSAISCRAKSAEINSCFLDVEPVAFNRGFYSVDITLFFNVTAEVVTTIGSCPQNITGVSVFNKKVVLYGGEGCAKIFSSDAAADCDQTIVSSNLPKAVVQCVDPMVLSSRVCNARVYSYARIPNAVLARAGISELNQTCGTKVLEVTLGLFTIVQIVRDVQLLIPVYDFCIPEKECPNTNDDPCERFSRIEFPTNEFFPSDDPRCGKGSSCACACDKDKDKEKED